MTSPEFPILGTEPLPVELANTLYGTGDERIDFLRTSDRVGRWFALVSARGGPAVSVTAMKREAHRTRLVRDSVRDLLSAAIDRSRPDEAAIDRLNAFARAAPGYPQLDWPSDGRPIAVAHDTATGAAAVLGGIATSCISLLTHPGTADALRRCETPDCTLLFVKSHPRRRWCHASCAHRERQARYYRRHRF
ncbi:ABATE domain-containing protein (plasmid) [Embleya sp. NBC_00888]|uniref:CGNR zinc finger domain-containing protein n=1 Tax=Embleya sp. NBC_00888 TaxID=2975960 RepID=UPI002F918C15|nr:ABATE domain-containing protein [Embleya sp. NBC_00888]